MNSTGAEKIGRDQRGLNAYHDGELSGLRRWIFERRLARSPGLRVELEALNQLTRCVQGLAQQPPSIDVWDEIAIQLPAIDAQPEGQRQSGAEQRDWRGMDWLAAYSRPLAAAGAAVALALALFLGIMEDGAPQIPGVIRWLDTGGRSVIVLEDQEDVTIVWLLDALEDEASEGGSREAV